MQTATAPDTSMAIERKSFDVIHFKVVDGAQGIAEIIPSVFGNTDLGGEIVAAGAFAESIARKRTPEGRIRIKGVWGHDWLTPVAITLDARELLPGDPLLPATLSQLGGLWVKAQFNLDTQRGREAFSDLQFGTCDEFSIGFRVLEDSFNQETGVRTLLRVELYEWSLVLVGMNPATLLLGTKDATETYADELERLLLRTGEIRSLRAKAGRPISEARRRRLIALRDELDALLAETEPKTDDEEEEAGKSAAPLEVAAVDREALVSWLAEFDLRDFTHEHARLGR